MKRLRAMGSVWLALMLLSACAGSETGSEPSGADTTPGQSSVAAGRELYEQTCAACHGIDLKGTETGPPFLDPIYAPNHHSDESFYAAVANGVQPHHWEFGPMPPQPSVAEEQVAAIVSYIRSQQEDAGITEDPSHP